jgi:hypothetical protein
MGPVRVRTRFGPQVRSVRYLDLDPSTEVRSNLPWTGHSDLLVRSGPDPGPQGPGPDPGQSNRPSAASLAILSASSLPFTLLWLEIHQIVSLHPVLFAAILRELSRY